MNLEKLTKAANSKNGYTVVPSAELAQLHEASTIKDEGFAKAILEHKDAPGLVSVKTATLKAVLSGFPQTPGASADQGAAPPPATADATAE